MMWLTKNEDGTPTGKGYSKPYCYHIDQFESLRPVFMQVFKYARAMGFDMIQGDHEDAPGQLELNWMYDDVLRNADRLSTYRQICAQVAREFNLIACFMTKPFMGVSASGCHTNMSLWTGGKDVVNKLSHKSLPAMDQKQKSLLVFLTLKLFVNFLGIKKLQEYLLLVLEIEKKEKIQELI